MTLCLSVNREIKMVMFEDDNVIIHGTSNWVLVYTRICVYIYMYSLCKHGQQNIGNRMRAVYLVAILMNSI